MPRPKGSVRLAGAKLKLKLLSRLISMGLVPGREVSVISKGSLGVLLESDNSMIFVGREVARLLSREADAHGR